VLKALEQQRVAGKRLRGIDERAEIEIALDAARAYERRTLLEHARFGGVATNRRDQRELVERLGQWDS
jgi:hypothetical protein